MTTVYRILPSDEWQRARVAGEFRGSAHDLRDGFIHFSTVDQVAETAHLHYASQANLLLLCVRLEALPKEHWRWEASRAGELFPHLYAVLPIAAVHRVDPLLLGADGVHQLPQLER
jgi:uncharacterized protein (DUF952 family)